MKLFMNRRGWTGMPLLIAIGLGIFILSGWSSVFTGMNRQGSLNSAWPGNMAYAAVSVSPRTGIPWWSKGTDASGRQQPAFTLSRRAEDEFDFELPNTGLKKPADIKWPYSGDLKYEMVRDAYAGYSIYPGKGTSSGAVAPGGSGGRLDEVLNYRYGAKASGQGLRLEIGGTFDASHKTGDVSYKAVLLQDSTALPQREILASRKDGKLGWKSLIYEYPEGSDPAKAKKKYVRDYLIAAHGAGWFFYTGADSPGYIALLMSAVDLNADAPPSVWVLGGGQMPLVDRIEGDITRIEPVFTRMTILPIGKAGAQLTAWWNASRKFYNGWMPPQGVRTFILFEEGANLGARLKTAGMSFAVNQYVERYSRGEDIVIAYVDSKDRLIRVEQIGGAWCTAVELKQD